MAALGYWYCPVMKACFFRKYGGPEVLEYGELPDPVRFNRAVADLMTRGA